MSYIVTRLCIDCIDTACVAVCPVDCIYEYTGSDREKFPNQLYVHPDECIDCGACEPACPWEAIFEESAVPEVFKEDTDFNRDIFEAHSGDDLTTDCEPIKQAPSPEEIAENKKKFGYE